MAKKLYYTTQEFIYPPTGYLYAAGIEVELDDWHPDDIKEALRNLIIEVKTPVVMSQPTESKQPAEGTPSKETEK